LTHHTSWVTLLNQLSPPRREAKPSSRQCCPHANPDCKQHSLTDRDGPSKKNKKQEQQKTQGKALHINVLLG
jgi:hypothetical protein